MYVPQVHPQLNLSFFDSVWFVFVTVSTVGYGDFSPHRYVGEKKNPRCTPEAKLRTTLRHD